MDGVGGNDALLALAHVGMRNAPKVGGSSVGSSAGSGPGTPESAGSRQSSTPPIEPSLRRGPLSGGDAAERVFLVPGQGGGGCFVGGYDSSESSSSDSESDSSDPMVLFTPSSVKSKSNPRSLSAKRERQFGQRTPSLEVCGSIQVSSPLNSSSSQSSCGSYFGKRFDDSLTEHKLDDIVEQAQPAPLKTQTPPRSHSRGRKGKRDDAYYELSSSGTLHVPGFLVKSSGVSPTPPEYANQMGLLEHTGSNVQQPLIQPRVVKRVESVNHRTELLRLAATNNSTVPTCVVDEDGEVAPVFNDEHLISVKRLGKGASGIVSLSLHSSALRLVAVKAVPVFDDGKRAQMVKELKTLYDNVVEVPGHGGVKKRPGSPARKSISPYIVGMYDAYVKKTEGTINLVLEWMDGGSVQDRVDEFGALPEPEIAVILHCVLRGLADLHKTRQLHRDIKPSNLLVSEISGLVKLSDFGITHSFGSFSAANTFVGSLSYMAPERISGDDEGYSYPADVWSVGLTVYVCATGVYPFQKAYDEHGYFGLVQEIEEQPSPKLDPRLFSPELCDFVNQCLKKDPKERLSARTLLTHPFLKEVHPFQSSLHCQTRVFSPTKGSRDSVIEKWNQLDSLLRLARHHHKNMKKQPTRRVEFSKSRLEQLARQIGLTPSVAGGQDIFNRQLDKRL